MTNKDIHELTLALTKFEQQLRLSKLNNFCWEGLEELSNSALALHETAEAYIELLLLKED